jgi:hypothetical protein
MACLPRAAFSYLTFDGAALVASNLGGQGGRCIDTCYSDGQSRQCFGWRALCHEQQPNTSVADTGELMGNTHILFRRLGTTESGVDRGREVWLRITNESEYRAWNPRHNGVKRTRFVPRTHTRPNLHSAAHASSSSRAQRVIAPVTLEPSICWAHACATRCGSGTRS